MTDDGIITNRMLLEHIQAGDNSLREELKSFRKEVKEEFKKIERKFVEVDHRFEEAHVHRGAIQEDLEATIRMQAEHESQLAVLTGRPSPENY